MNKKIFVHFHVRKKTTERRRRCGNGHRISGDTAGSRFQKPAISLKKSWGGYCNTTPRVEVKTMFLSAARGSRGVGRRPHGDGSLSPRRGGEP